MPLGKDLADSYAALIGRQVFLDRAAYTVLRTIDDMAATQSAPDSSVHRGLHAGLRALAMAHPDLPSDYRAGRDLGPT